MLTEDGSGRSVIVCELLAYFFFFCFSSSSSSSSSSSLFFFFLLDLLLLLLSSSPDLSLSHPTQRQHAHFMKQPL